MNDNIVEVPKGVTNADILEQIKELQNKDEHLVALTEEEVKELKGMLAERRAITRLRNQYLVIVSIVGAVFGVFFGLWDWLFRGIH